MRICLFALTGFGNSILKSLIKCDFVSKILVITRKEKGPFPHYRCAPIKDICRKNNVGLIYGISFRKIKAFKPDMIIAATFHKKIPQNIIKLAKDKTVNIHPSLLPDYRGPNPTNWAIINGERKTGVTFQLLSKGFDCGDILFQKSLLIKNLTDGELRARLAKLAGVNLKKFLRAFLASKLKPTKIKRSQGSYYPRITSRKAAAIFKFGDFKKNDIIRGLTPYPGIYVTKGINKR